MNAPRPSAMVRVPAQPLPHTRTNLRVPNRATPVMRRYQISYLNNRGEITDFQRMAPALPMFEAAASAFARGALIATDNGPVAVEDLLPGTKIQTRDGMLPLKWRSSMTMVPNPPKAYATPAKLTRVSADSFGLGRPTPDLLLGPGARLVQQCTRAAARFGDEVFAMPAAAFANGESAIRITPISSVEVYHLDVGIHTSIIANGMDCESYHPGTDAAKSLPHEIAPLFLSLFPHVTGFEGFGRQRLSRLSIDDVQELCVA